MGTPIGEKVRFFWPGWVSLNMLIGLVFIKTTPFIWLNGTWHHNRTSWELPRTIAGLLRRRIR